MFDSNGANTTAAAAVVAAARHLDLSSTTSLVLAGTGPVGQRAAWLLADAGGRVRVASRNIERAEQTCQRLSDRVAQGRFEPSATGTDQERLAALEGVDLVIAAGAAGVQLLSESSRANCNSLRVAIDLNAVPPLGLEGIEATDAGQDRQGVIAYGALGIGGTKMKIHRAAVQRLFEDNSLVLDAREIYQLGCELESG
jgi:glutamyl-tRNA reductase